MIQFGDLVTVLNDSLAITHLYFKNVIILYIEVTRSSYSNSGNLEHMYIVCKETVLTHI